MNMLPGAPAATVKICFRVRMKVVCKEAGGEMWRDPRSWVSRYCVLTAVSQSLLLFECEGINKYH